MKKRFLSIALAGALAATALVGCGKKEETNSGENNNKPDTEVTGGSVYYLNFKPEQDLAWQRMAEIYTEKTGVKVTVVTAAAGSYESTLAAEIDKTNAPTLFQVNGPVGLANWSDYCYDLKDSTVYKELTSDSFALKDGDAVLGVSYVIESYGLITNTKLLDKAGYKVSDIKSFADLKKVAEDITARSEELGFSAFTSAGMDGSSDWRFKTHLANLPIYFEYQADKIGSSPAIKGTYLENYKNIWDLYINNATCDPKDLSTKTGNDAVADFTSEKAVFYQNGSWAYGDVKSIGDENLQMIPIYVGAGDEANQGLCTGTENYWCVNKKASEADIKATLDFLAWLVTDEDAVKTLATAPTDKDGNPIMTKDAEGKDVQVSFNWVIPYKNAAKSDNLFVQQDTEYTNNGMIPVSWNFTTMPSEVWKNGVGEALTAYAADQTAENWDKVKAAFVDGWKIEYDATHAE
jgi:raffinose/stachyose/melibiose transport system substrate-binding protein